MAAELEKLAKELQQSGYPIGGKRVQDISLTLIEQNLIPPELPFRRYRAVLWDYPEGWSGGGGPDSTLSYEQLPKTDWFRCREDAEEAGKKLNAQTGYDFFVRIVEIRKFFVTWEDGEDHQSHGMTIEINAKVNPNAAAQSILSRHGNLKEHGFVIDHVRPVNEGESPANF